MQIERYSTKGRVLSTQLIIIFFLYQPPMVTIVELVKSGNENANLPTPLELFPQLPSLMRKWWKWNCTTLSIEFKVS